MFDPNFTQYTQALVHLFGRVWSYLIVSSIYLMVIESSIWCSPVEFNQKISQIRQNIGTLIGIPVAHQTYMLLLTGKHFVKTRKTRRGWHWKHDSRALGRHRDAGPGPLVQAFLCGLQRVCWNPGPVDRTASAARPHRHDGESRLFDKFRSDHIVLRWPALILRLPFGWLPKRYKH